MHVKEPNIRKREYVVHETLKFFYQFTTQDIYNELWDNGIYVQEDRLVQILKTTPGIVRIGKDENNRQMWERRVLA